MKIKNISKASSFTAQLVGYNNKVITLKPGEIKKGLPLNCYKGLKGVPNMIKICWEDLKEKSTLEVLNPVYYNVGEFNTETPTDNKPTVVEVTEVTVEPDSLKLKVKEKTALKVTVLPENATDKKFVVLTSDENVVKITKKGNLEAVGVGSAVITASATNGVKAECTVVVESDEVPAADTEADASTENTEETQQ